ncbi:MAG TPA: branched-chain amino acid ABC transporter permease [Candidatus Sulfotelmatobacter sp.]|nr:branched-chain amino acid ABC transporter permease [Candidatus Sulfotelmatobacter sp.]
MLLQQLVNGLMLGASYALIAVAFALILGIFDMLNIAIGEVFMLGAFFGLTLVNLGLPFPAALLVAMLLAGLVNLVIERFAFRPLRGTPPVIPLLSSIGFSMLLQDAATNIWGAERTQFPPSVRALSFEIGPVLLSSVQMVILGTAVALMVVLQFVLQRTAIGRGMRAVAESPETAGILGVDAGRVLVATFFASGALAGAAGMLVGLTFSVISPFIGIEIGLKGVAAMVVGGAGNIQGAMLAGPLLGVAEVLSVAYLGAAHRDVVVYGLLILVLVVRPAGLLGTVERARL